MKNNACIFRRGMIEYSGSRETQANIRVWRSLVSRLNGVQEAAGSNPVTRTNRSILWDTPIFFLPSNKQGMPTLVGDVGRCPRRFFFPAWVSICLAWLSPYFTPPFPSKFQVAEPSAPGPRSRYQAAHPYCSRQPSSGSAPPQQSSECPWTFRNFCPFMLVPRDFCCLFASVPVFRKQRIQERIERFSLFCGIALPARSGGAARCCLYSY